MGPALTPPGPHPDGGGAPQRRHERGVAAGPDVVHLARPSGLHAADRRRQRGQRALGRGAALTLGLDAEEIVAAFPHVSPRPRRFQVLSAPAGAAGTASAAPDSPPFTVVVDYAHTPAGLEVVLDEARGLAGDGGEVLVAFGCGGQGSGQTAKDGAHRIAPSAMWPCSTVGQPRDEDPFSIIDEVRAGPPRPTRHLMGCSWSNLIGVPPSACYSRRPAPVTSWSSRERPRGLSGDRRRAAALQRRAGGSPIPVGRFPTDPSTWVGAPSAETTPKGE